MGYNDIYSTPDGKVLFVCIGDMQPGGFNNVRMALSTDNGHHFSWKGANILDDARLVEKGGRQSCACVDPESTTLKDGRVRLFVMTQACQPPIPGREVLVSPTTPAR